MFYLYPIQLKQLNPVHLPYLLSDAGYGQRKEGCSPVMAFEGCEVRIPIPILHPGGVKGDFFLLNISICLFFISHAFSFFPVTGAHRTTCFLARREGRYLKRLHHSLKSKERLPEQLPIVYSLLFAVNPYVNLWGHIFSQTEIHSGINIDFSGLKN